MTKRILVVEDSPTQLVKMEMALEDQGFEAIGAGTAEKALEMFAGARPDLVIVDYHLPGIKGDEFCRQLRMNINTRSVPILMLTMDQTMAAELHGLESGADDYVSKTEDIDILMLRVQALLRKSPASDDILSTDQTHQPRVLVIEDSPTYAQWLTEELTREGYLVAAALRGAEGLDLAAHGQFDCVLVDLVMPGFDGVEVCQRLSSGRQLSDEQPVVILMISAHETKENVARALEAGADDFLGKSSDIAIIKARVRALLRRKFIGEQNRKLLEHFRAKEMETLRARAATEAAEAKAALAEELRQINRELEAANRKLRETQAQLVHSEKMASLGQLVAGIAHEINNPLSYVLSHVFSVRQWLSEVREREGERLSTGAADKVAKAVSRIDDMGQGLERVKNLVVKLRSFSHLDKGEFSLLDVNDALDSVLLFLQHKIKDRIEVTRHFDPNGALKCNAGQINQVLMNVLSNAVDAIDGPGRIVITTGREGGQFVLTVEDSGCGIAAEVRERIFDPFFTTKPIGQGTGLGLSISYGIIQAHHGTIAFESEVGRGTKAIIRIPAALNWDDQP